MHNNAMHACLDNLKCMHSDLIFHFILIENFVKNFKNMYFGILFAGFAGAGGNRDCATSIHRVFAA